MAEGMYMQRTRNDVSARDLLSGFLLLNKIEVLLGMFSFLYTSVIHASHQLATSVLFKISTNIFTHTDVAACSTHCLHLLEHRSTRRRNEFEMFSVPYPCESGGAEYVVFCLCTCTVYDRIQSMHIL